ncbi:hypothetical protein [Pseudoscardovia suis]
MSDNTSSTPQNEDTQGAAQQHAPWQARACDPSSDACIVTVSPWLVHFQSPALSGAVYVPFQYGLFVSPSSLTHRIVIVSAVIAASIHMSVLLEFACFQVPIKFAGCSVMCEWRLAHSGVSDVLDGGFGGYV